MKRTKVLAALMAGLTLLSTGCGVSDSVKSVMLTSSASSSGGFFNLVGADGTLQLTALAIYNSGKTIDITNQVSTYTVTTVGVDANFGAPLPPYGPTTVPINATGLMTAVESLCTWENIAPPPGTPPSWVYTGYYNVTATYKGIVSQPVAIGVGSETSNSSTSGGCGPT